MSRNKDHGERNKALSEQLLDGKVYYDWVITTAFYSSIHFVEDKILPCTINGVSCSNINDVKSAYKMAGRHQSRERLVWEKMSSLTAIKYKWLDDRSRNARYTTFKITIAEAEKAKEYLQAIYKECYL
ncbi:hypothetical protein [Pontibacter populi]|uniref:Uncharacterized protein n=1 Tax=Pontibacter populi TaxID=890055 RepID=A0ABV1RPR0_9BACT